MSFPAERTPWYTSIVTRTTVVFALLLVAAVTITGWITFRDSSDQVIAQARADMRHTLDLVSARTVAFSNTLEEDISFLSDNYSIHAFCAQLDTTDTIAFASSREREALLLESFIRSRPIYGQVRVIGADSLGLEVLRFDQQQHHAVRVADSLLQPKGDRDYYQAAIRMAEGVHYFSPIELNREHGHVSHPLMPTLRVAAPLFTPHGARAGIVIINTDLRDLFAELDAIVPQGTTLLLANAKGELLMHPDTARTFRFEFGGSSKLDAALSHALDADTLMTARADITLGPTEERYTFVIAQPTVALLGALREKRDASLRIVALISGAAVLLAMLFALGLRGRLGKLTQRVERYAIGGSEALPVQRRDEVGRLARGLQQMHDRIDARVKELEEARAKAEASDKQRRDLLANMSHEVRTPLNAIIGMAADIDTSRMSEGDREKLAIVQRSGQRLKGLVDDLLMHARIGEGKLAVRPVATDVRGLITDIARAHQSAAATKGIALRARLDDLPQRVMIDPLRLHQIIDNLVANAIRFTRKGHVDITASASADQLRILVEDTGEGIAESEQQRVFERFERATTSEHDEQGAGLGLAITKRIVDLLGGSIMLRSEVGKGSSFTVELPIIADALAPAPAAAPSVDTAGLRVLYVEDVATNRMLIEEWATKWKWGLALATDGEEAIAACEKNLFDLLLIDLDLGHGMRGSELAMRLRGTKRHRYAPMIAVTAFVEEAQGSEALKAGMNDRVTKPIDRDLLVNTCAFWCDRSPALAEAPDLVALNAQYDNDKEQLLKVYQQYRKEFTQRRLALRDALEQQDADALSTARHQIRPHWELLGLKNALRSLDDLSIDATEEERAAIEDVFRACDRELLRAQRILLVGTSI